MDRKTNFVMECFCQSACSKWLAKTSHIFDCQKVSASFFKLFCKVYIILQCVLVSFGVEYIAGVTDSGFAQGPTLLNSCHGDLHVWDPVQWIKNSEYVDSSRCRFPDKSLNNIVRIICVSHGITCTKEHLEKNVWYLFTQSGQTLPRTLLQKSHRGIKGCATPHLE